MTSTVEITKCVSEVPKLVDGLTFVKFVTRFVHFQILSGNC